jgi:hypothetical protein
MGGSPVGFGVLAKTLFFWREEKGKLAASPTERTASDAPALQPEKLAEICSRHGCLHRRGYKWDDTEVVPPTAS